MENDALLKRLKELERRAEEAEQQRQLERQRAEEADQRAEEAEKLNRPTTLSEYLEACHDVEDPVRSIVEHLVSVDEVRAAFALGDGIVFENHPNAISDISEEVVDRLATPQRPRTPDQPRFERLRLRPDQICIYRQEGETSTQRTMLYLNEYKAPHKITPQHLRVGLRSIDIYKEVVNRATIPTAADPEALFQCHSERLVAAAITQTFHYMIEGGLDQVLAFSLLALDYSQGRRYHRQDEREAVMSSLKTWSEDVETILKTIPVDQRKAPSSSPAYEPDPYSDVDRSPCISRKRKPRKPPGNVMRIGVPAHSPESSDDESTRRMQETPTPLEPRRSGRIQAAQRALPNHTRKDGHDVYRSRQQNDGYCTEECLHSLTLQTKTRLDENCPNVAAHRHDGDGLHHRISHARFVTLLRDQLKRTLDDGIESLDKGGARGVLFKVTLLAYGYTFIGKGRCRHSSRISNTKQRSSKPCSHCRVKPRRSFSGQSTYVQYHALTTTTSASEFNT
ncbi:hypothetical protein PG987_000101 [Apiospora arundinis]